MPPKYHDVGKRTRKSKPASKPSSSSSPSSATLPQSSTPDTTGPIYFWRPQEVETGYLSQWYAFPFRGRGADKDKAKEDKEGEGEAEDKIYATAEHYMMHHKALLFGDAEIAAAILETPSPRDVKALGRAVRGFDPAVWERERARIVVEGNWCKFSLPIVDPVFENCEGEGAGVAGAREEGKGKGRSRGGGGNGEEKKEEEKKVDEGPGPGHGPNPGLRTWRLGNADGALEVRGASFRDVLLATGDRELVEASPRDRIWGIGFGAKNAGANRRRWGLNLLGKCLMEVREQFRSEDEAMKVEDGAGA
ncbi:DUF1768-domain-containing protein [Nemania serpens]|nr:DUF1768-domain-containing protein [Nemania serpens]